ncbi:hypothetical protein L873DRAFT_940432 [Choiromyces venosus 120613-1]|uniref:EF-hand domain-containing protein n=1 Tax=Choiromyces venosus 120613-1 TaxID=1336337 RepID=A0A3N4K751_9PEZI|nr:hypothetical protein L873DRAFT_940432 [Choiromyces venosus 120613-1]
MSGLNRKSTGDLKAAAGQDPSKTRPSSTTPGPSTHSALPPSSIPRPATSRQTSTPTRLTSYRNEVGASSNNQNNTETTGVGLGVGLGLGGSSRPSRPSPPSLINGRNSPALRRTLSAQSKFQGRPHPFVTATGSPARIPVLSNRKKKLKKREGSQDGSSSSSTSSSEMESDTTATKDFFKEDQASHPFNAREFYATIFSKYDPQGTGSVAVRDVVAILRELEEGSGGAKFSILSEDGALAVQTAMENDPSLIVSQPDFEDMVQRLLGFELIDRMTEIQSSNTSQEEQPANHQQSPLNIDTSTSRDATFEGLGGGLLRSPGYSSKRSPSTYSPQEDSLFGALNNPPRPYAENGNSVGDDSTGCIGVPPVDSSTPIRNRKPVNSPGSGPALVEQGVRRRFSRSAEEGEEGKGGPFVVNPVWLEMSLEPAALGCLTAEDLKNLLHEFRHLWEVFESRRRRLEEVDGRLDQANQRYSDLTAYWEQECDTIENKNRVLQEENERLAEEAKKSELQDTKNAIMMRTMEDDIAKSETRIKELEHAQKQEVRRREEVQSQLLREVNTMRATRAKLTESERINEKLLSETQVIMRDLGQLQTEIGAKEEELSAKERDITYRDMRIENLEKEVNKIKGDYRALESQSRAANRVMKGSVRGPSTRLGEEIGNLEPEEPHGMASYDSLEDVFKDYPHFRPNNLQNVKDILPKLPQYESLEQVCKDFPEIKGLIPLPQPEGHGGAVLPLPSGLGIGGQMIKEDSSQAIETDLQGRHLTSISEGAAHAATLPETQDIKAIIDRSDAGPGKDEPLKYDARPENLRNINEGDHLTTQDMREGRQYFTGYGNTVSDGGRAGGDDSDNSSDGDDDDDGPRPTRGLRGGSGRAGRRSGRGGGDPDGDDNSSHDGRGNRGGGRRRRKARERERDGVPWVGQFRFTGIDGEYTECIRTTLETRAYLRDLADKPRLTLSDVEFLNNFVTEQSSPPDQVILQEIWGLASKAERAVRRTLREKAWPARGEKAAFGFVNVNSPFGIFAWPWRQLWDIAFSLDDADYQLPGTNAYQDYINEQRMRTAQGGGAGGEGRGEGGGEGGGNANDDTTADTSETAPRRSDSVPGVAAKRIIPEFPPRPHRTPVASILRAGPKPGAAWGILTFIGLGLILTLAIYNSLIFLRMRSDQQSWEFANGSRSSAGPFWSVENSCWSNCLSGVCGGSNLGSTKWRQWEWFWTQVEAWMASSEEPILPS